MQSDTLEDSVRLFIPQGLACRPGTAPASETTAPRAISDTNAVSINVSIEMRGLILDLNSPSHHAEYTLGYSDESFKVLSPANRARLYNPNNAFVKFTSRTFLNSNFILTWNTPAIDGPRCIVEQLRDPYIPAGESPTFAFALTQVSNLDLPPADLGK